MTTHFLGMDILHKFVFGGELFAAGVAGCIVIGL